VAYDPPTDRLTGVATISATATQNLSRFNLDFVGLTVRSIKVNGRAASWSRTDHELMVTPRHGLPKGHRFTTVVRYDGVPITQQLVLGPGFTIEAGFIHTDDGAIVAGQPEVAASWFPVNDHPIDKASYTFVVTAPAGLQVVANGRLLGRTRHGARRTWVWNAPEPMASYLATVNIGQFDTHRYRTDDGLWMYDALDPDLFDEAVDPGDPASATLGGIAQGSFARQDEILNFLERRFSRYPFSTGGGIVDDYDNLQFALETQTRPVYSKFFFTTPANGDSVVVHELAHQWFGDSVALAEWKHIWLNEGFAQYAEWMWSEEEGLGTAHEQFDALYQRDPRRRPVLAVRDRRPRSRAPVRHRRVLPGRDGRAHAAPGGRRPRLLPHPACLDDPAGRRQRHHPAVHQAGRADLGRAAGRPVPGLAVHREQAGAGGGRRRSGLGLATGALDGAYAPLSS